MTTSPLTSSGVASEAILYSRILRDSCRIIVSLPPFPPKKQKTGSGINWIYVIHTTRLFWVLSNCLL